ncbi:hypothetical protein C21_02743 [Arenibacter sp. NBRC 103722]|jgi:hypothetical protein|nr:MULTISPECIES: hypothetical protein [Arenibacter]GBF20570.1 hypothetical protein C21_02743 [Arenibacter sp. NBRC 103722]
MSQNRRNRRKNQEKRLKGSISKRDKIYGILAIVLLFLLAAILVIINAIR